MSKAFSHNDRPPKAPTDLSHIRLAGTEDEMQIFSLCSLMHAEVALHQLNWPKVAAMIRLATQRTRGIVGVIGEPHDLKAAIFTVIEPVWYSDEFILMEYFNYVRPDARSAPTRPTSSPMASGAPTISGSISLRGYSRPLVPRRSVGSTAG